MRKSNFGHDYIQHLFRDEAESTTRIQLNQTAVIDFLKAFSGRIDVMATLMKAHGLDTTRLEQHLTQLNSIVMIRLVAIDISGLREKVAKSPPTKE